MTGQTLTRWLKAGYPYLKAKSGLPAWLLPERSFNSTVEQVGEQGVVSLGNLLETGCSLQGRSGDHSGGVMMLSTEQWQAALEDWSPLSHFREVVGAFVEVADGIMAQFPQINSRIEPVIISRNLAVILLAPLVSQGKALADELAVLLDTNASQPAQLVLSYGDAVIRGDIARLEKVNRCIVRYPAWHEWSVALQEATLKCHHKPRLITVTPPLSVELTNVLTLMVKGGKEGYDAS